MVILTIRKETYFRLERLAQAKNMNVDSLVSVFLDDAEHDHEEIKKIISILQQASPSCTGADVNVKTDNVIYGIQFRGGSNEID